jgi:hypothetical protein
MGIPEFGLAVIPIRSFPGSRKYTFASCLDPALPLSTLYPIAEKPNLLEINLQVAALQILSGDSSLNLVDPLHSFNPFAFAVWMIARA